MGLHRKEYLRKKRNDDYKKELEGYELWIREGEKISESEAIKEQRRLGRLSRDFSWWKVPPFFNNLGPLICC